MVSLHDLFFEMFDMRVNRDLSGMQWCLYLMASQGHLSWNFTGEDRSWLIVMLTWQELVKFWQKSWYVWSWRACCNVLRIRIQFCYLCLVSSFLDLDERMLETACHCFSLVRLYILRESSERWPVRSWIIFLLNTTQLHLWHGNCDL